MEKLPEFAHESRDGLDIAKLQQHVTSKYPTFFNFLDRYKLSYRVFAVSCVPVKEHLRVDPEKGSRACFLLVDEGYGKRPRSCG